MMSIEAIPVDDDDKKIILSRLGDLYAVLNEIYMKCKITRIIKKHLGIALRKLIVDISMFADNTGAVSVVFDLFMDEILDVMIRTVVDAFTIMIADIKEDKILYDNRDIFVKIGKKRFDDFCERMNDIGIIMKGLDTIYTPDLDLAFLRECTADPVVIEHFERFNAKWIERKNEMERLKGKYLQ